MCKRGKYNTRCRCFNLVIFPNTATRGAAAHYIIYMFFAYQERDNIYRDLVCSLYGKLANSVH